MAYGGLINKVVDPFNIGATPTPSTPKPGKVGQDYLGLVNAYSQGMPTIFNTEAQYKNQFAGLDLSNLENILPGFSDAFHNINPGQTDLMHSLTDQAQSGLDAGAGIDPALQRVFQQSTRAGESARGLGHGPSDVLDESMALTNLGQGLRTQRQGFASNVAGLNSQADQLPILSGAGALAQGSGPTLIPGNQSYDAFNTAYNARAAANISGANNAAAANNSY